MLLSSGRSEVMFHCWEDVFCIFDPDNTGALCDFDVFRDVYYRYGIASAIYWDTQPLIWDLKDNALHFPAVDHNAEGIMRGYVSCCLWFVQAGHGEAA